MKILIKKILSAVFPVIAVLILLSNLCLLYKTYRLAAQDIKQSPVLEPGIEFKEFQDDLNKVKKAGFLTDKDMSPEKNDGQFLAAQYILSPTVLDLNNPNHTFAVLDYTNTEIAHKKIKSLGAIVIAVSPYGKILVKNP